MPQIAGHCHISQYCTCSMSTIQVYNAWQHTLTKILTEGLPVKMGKSLSQNTSSPLIGEDIMGLSWIFFEDEY